MSYRVSPSPDFLRDLKRLSKRYPSIQADVEIWGESMEEDPRQGTPIGRNCYKVRLAIRSKGRGKSGGARVITCIVAIREVVYLLAIYDKSEQETLSDGRIKKLLDELRL